jgi:hypothetical protein
VEEAVRSRRRVAGLTHTLYRYPARFPPEFAKAAIEEFTDPGDWVLDPFVGGGTSVVEALAAGRKVAATDLNPLAVLLTTAKSTPLYRRDEAVLRSWAASDAPWTAVVDSRLRNAPSDYVAALGHLAAAARELDKARQRDAAKALLVHVGQWGLDGRQTPVPADHLRAELDRALDSHVAGVRALVAAVKAQRLRPSDLLRRRLVRHGDAGAIAAGRGWNRVAKRFRLVLTSPPYPSVHVLYLRWQVRGRTETALPYWLSDLRDGVGEAYYTMGGRSEKGEATYFATITRTFSGIRRLLLPDARVVQLVSFREATRQLPLYMDAMQSAGYEVMGADPMLREVPNRRWYYRVAPERGGAHEYLLVHRSRT